MVRLKDIAVRAGVSVMTVSKVLRNAPDISAMTKTRVRCLADQMGYMPDTVAQGLRNRRTRMLGLVIPAATNPVFARVVLGLEEQAYELGFDLIHAHSLSTPEREESVLRRLVSRRVEGLFIAPVYRLETTAPVYEELKRREIPTLLLGHAAPFCESFTSVAADDLAASYAMTRHLLDLGHRRIAFFNGPTAAPASGNNWKATAARCGKRASNRTTAWSLPPAAPSKKVRPPRRKCSRKLPTPPPSRPPAIWWPSARLRCF